MAKREGEPIVKPTVPAPHTLAELIAQMLVGVAHVPRVEQARMVADAAKAAAKWHDARVAELECRIAKQSKMNHEALRAEIVNYRAIRPDDLCKRCSGMGVRSYGSTATWRGGIGGQAFTIDVCDQCWGSGSASRPWPSRKEQRERDKQSTALTARVAELEQRDAGRVEMLATACEQITELKAERDRLRDKNAQYRDVLEEISEGFGYPGNARTPEELSANQMMQMAAAALTAKDDANAAQPVATPEQVESWKASVSFLKQLNQWYPENHQRRNARIEQLTRLIADTEKQLAAADAAKEVGSG